jgi:hypothetical protein
MYNILIYFYVWTVRCLYTASATTRGGRGCTPGSTSACASLASMPKARAGRSRAQQRGRARPARRRMSRCVLDDDGCEMIVMMVVKMMVMMVVEMMVMVVVCPSLDGNDSVVMEW